MYTFMIALRDQNTAANALQYDMRCRRTMHGVPPDDMKRAAAAVRIGIGSSRPARWRLHDLTHAMADGPGTRSELQENFACRGQDRQGAATSGFDSLLPATVDDQDDERLRDLAGVTVDAYMWLARHEVVLQQFCNDRCSSTEPTDCCLSQ